MRSFPLFLASALLTQPLVSAPSSCENPPQASWEDAFSGPLAREKRAQLLKTPECQELLTTLGLTSKTGLFKTDSFAVFHRGKILFSEDKAPFTFQTPHPLWSASKSIASTVIGAALQQIFTDQSLALDSKVADFLDIDAEVEKSMDPARIAQFAKITLQDLLEMASSFAWNESYNEGAKGSSVLEMIYLNPSQEMTRYILRRPFTGFEPGTKFQYSSGDIMLAMAVLKKACEKKPGCQYDKLPWQVLFDRIGARGVVFEKDKGGVFIAPSYLHMSSFDMARIGELFRCEGKWGKEQILPLDWVAETRIPNKAYENKNTVIKDLLGEGVYGRTWWLNRKATNKGYDRSSYPSFPEDMYAAMGHYGQIVMIIPSLELVVVRTGSDLEYNKKVNTLGEKLFPCLNKFGVGS